MKINPAILKPHPLLALLPYTVVKRLLADTAVTEYPKGTVLFRQGERCDAIYVILSGRCETQYVNGDGQPHIEAVFGPGDTLGERSFLNDEPHRCTAIVSTHGIVLRIPATELEGILTKDPKLAGQFSQAVTRRFRVPGSKLSETTRVRRIATLLAQAPHADAPAVGQRLAASLRKITGQKVLLLRLAHEGQLSPHPWIFPEPHISQEFLFERQVQPRDEGYDELRLPVEADKRYAQAIAPLLGECGRHYDYVLVHIDATLPEATILQCIIQADLAYVLLQPSVQNVYEFQLLTSALKEEAPNACNHVKPIVLAESALDMEQTHDVLKHLGLSVHSFARGFPQNDAPAWPDKRFDLHINRLAREIGRCRVGLALSSGAAKGLAHAGVIQVLEESGIEVDVIAGASMGAYVGALWAYGIEGAGLEKIAREHEGRWGLFSLLEPALPPRRGFIHARKISKRLRRTLGSAHFSDMVRPLRVMATRLETLERVVFASGEVVQAVEASIAIPGICVPVTIDNEIYVDGGVVDPLPVDVLEEMGIEKIIAVNVIPSSEQLRYWRERELEMNGRPKFSFRRWMNQQINYFAAGNVFDTMVQAFNGAQMLVAENTGRRADVLLRPVTCESFWCDFTHPQKYIKLGRDAAEAQLAQLLALTAPATDERPNLSSPDVLRAA